MRVFVFVWVIAVLGLTTTSAQRTPPRTSTRDIGTRTSADADRRLRQIRALEIKRTKVDADTPESGIPEIYRRPTDEETAALAPSPWLREKYSEFLRRSGTGLITLNANPKCTSDPDIVSADASCAQFQFPGGGASYSFRYGSYRIPRLSDLTLERDVLKTDSIAQQGILVDLGEADINEINIKSKGMRFLAEFVPARTIRDMADASKGFEKGVDANGFLYRLAFFAKAGRTFGLRSIAFPGRSPRTYKGTVFNELSIDKREDVIVVFRIVDVSRDGNITILWRELARRESPELKG